METNRIEKYVFEGMGNIDFFIKNNAFIGNSQSNTDGAKVSPLSKMEMMVIQTAFFMAHQLNQTMGKHKTYDAETEFIISLKKFAELWRIIDGDKPIEDKAFYTTIRRAISKVDKRRFLYPDLNAPKGTKAVVLSGYFGSVKFITSQNNGSEISFSFPKDLIPYLKNYGQYTWYYFENVIKLRDHPNAIILYEYFSKYKNKLDRVSEKEIVLNLTVPRLRNLLSVGDGYDCTDMVRKIVKPAIAKINLDTTMFIDEIEFVKSGRVIESVNFKVTFTNDDLDFNDAIEQVNKEKPLLSENQIFKYTLLLTKNQEFLDVFREEAEGDHEFISRVAMNLKDNDMAVMYYPYLQACGFSSKKIEAIIEAKTKKH